jgi:hypothetical protein
MIRTELFDKKSLCHALLQPSSDPDILIPVKAIIEDIHFDEDIPVYSIRVIKFYDSIDFLKYAFYEKSFITVVNRPARALKIPKHIRTLAQLEEWTGQNTKYRFCVESNLVSKSKADMIELFNKIQEYLICQKLRFIKRVSTRAIYEGPLKISSHSEFNNRIRRGFSDLFEAEDDTTAFIETIG